MGQQSKQYGTYEKQQELLKMIKDIDAIFKKHNINYSLCGGTLLGAIRERGFIPWDDDIDIMVERQIFNRILNVFNESECDSEYILTRILWVYRIQKRNDSREGLMVPTIDIFVMDHCPDNPLLRKTKVFLIKALQGMMKKEQRYSDMSFFYRLCLWITHIIGQAFCDERKYKWYQAVSQIGNKKETTNISCYNGLFKHLTLMYSNNTLCCFKQAAFEDAYLPVTLEYDSYLKTLYGDYMTPPKEEDRVPSHTH